MYDRNPRESCCQFNMFLLDYFCVDYILSLIHISVEQVVAALRETPTAIVWAMHTAVLASLMPLLEEDAQPFFYPALRLSLIHI